MSVQLALNLRSSTARLPSEAGARLIYVLLDVAAQSQPGLRMPIHCCLVVDCSPSMRVPIADESMFRELMRRGLASEVMLDGLPVWQVPGGIPSDLQGRAVSPSRWLAQAVGSAAERLDDADRISMIAFASSSRTLLHHQLPSDTAALRVALHKIERSDFGSKTVLAEALGQALDIAHESRATSHASRVILLTDGFVEDAAPALELANGFGAAGVPITTIGLGIEFQEQLLLGLADRSGGRATMITDAKAIPPLLDRELERSGRVLAKRARLDLRLAQGVELRKVFRVRPELAELPPLSLSAGAGSVAVGALERNAAPTFLLELVAPPRPAGEFRLLRATAHADQADGSPAPSAYAELVVGYAPGADDSISPELGPTIDRVAAFQLQSRALDAAAEGDSLGATRKLAAAVTRLIELGEHDLAARAAATAKQLAETGQIETADAKALRYATRRLTEGG
ncbi:MAG TPA: VWA domain-containing protein [Herpetosiphonaceae bacterium]